MPSTYFTEDEAREKIGKEIKTLIDFANVPEGTAGKVTGFFETPIPCPERFGVYITWRITEYPLIDGFSKDEYTQFIVEIGESIECLCKDCKMTEQMCRHRKTGAATPNPIQLLAATLDQLEKEEKEDPERNVEFTFGVKSTIKHIRKTFGIPEPKGR